MKLWRFLLVGIFVLGACDFVRPPRGPVTQVADQRHGPERARGVIVLLPGFGDDADDFKQNGFTRLLHKHAPGYDIVATNAHFGYYRKGIVIERLEADVVSKLRVQGYKEIWFAGASMGGFGAVGMARKHPDKVKGLLLFAPYMGQRALLEEAKYAGGLCKWQSKPVDKEVDRDTFARANLIWLKQQACEPGGLPIFVGVGASDRMLPGTQVLDDQLDPSHVVVLPGGHGWKVWTPALDVLAPRAFAAYGGPAPAAVAAD